jgi:DNA-binding response OmpR family regulator
LVVEDSLVQRTVLRRVLVEEGYEVIEAGDGLQGLERLENRTVDLIISDIEMPEMDGCEMCLAVRHDPRLASTPVMLVTALTSPTELVRGIMAEADTYITKPYKPEMLLQRVRSLIGSGRHVPPAGATWEVSFAGATYDVPGDPQYTLNFLLATYENVVEQNRELDMLVYSRHG